MRIIVQEVMQLVTMIKITFNLKDLLRKYHADSFSDLEQG